jgi:hypothetical protein
MSRKLDGILFIYIFFPFYFMRIIMWKEEKGVE